MSLWSIHKKLGPTLAAGLAVAPLAACTSNAEPEAEASGTSGGTSTAEQGSNDESGDKVVIGGTLLSGGRGTIVGTVLGVLIFSTLSNVFTQNNLSSSAQSVAKGLIIVAAVLLQQRLATRSNSGT
jgi:ribose transport system permease protein